MIRSGIALGRLDRQGVIYTSTPSIGVGGAVKLTLTKCRDLFLTDEKDNPSVRSTLVVGKDTEVADAVFRTRWFTELRNGMVLVVEGRTYTVLRREELGRREGWRIFAKEVPS